MNNIITNREKVSLKIANSLYEMGIYLEPNLTSLVQFDINQNRFKRVDNARFQNYINAQSPSLAIDLSENILKHIPVLSDFSNVYNNYVNHKSKVDFNYIAKIEEIINGKYQLDKSYKHLSKSEKEMLEQLAEENIYYCGSKYRYNTDNKSKCENNCFVKHRNGLTFDYISLYNVFGRENIEPLNFTEWGKYLPNVDMDKIRDYYVLNNFKKENIDLISYVNKEMGI